MAPQETGIECVGEVVELFCLSWIQSFKRILELSDRRGDLPGECCRVVGYVEGLCRNYAGCLMVSVIFSGDTAGQPGHQHFRTGQAEDADNLFEHRGGRLSG